MKKIIALVLLLAMLMTLAACGKKKEEKKEETTAATEETVEVEVLPEPASSWDKFSTEATMEATTLTAEDSSVVTIGSLSYDETSVEIGFAFKNNAEEERSATISMLSINGMMFPCSPTVWADAGEEAKDAVVLTMNELRLRGVFEIATIEISVYICNTEWELVECLSAELKTSVEPRKEADTYYVSATSEGAQQTENYTVIASVNERVELGEELFLESKIYARGQDGDRLMLEIVNEGEEMRSVAIYTSQVNTMESYDSQDQRIYPGSRAVLMMDIPRTKMEAFGMDEIYEIKFDVAIYPCDENGEVDWENALLEVPFTYNIPGATITEPDMSGTEIYKQDGLRILMKAPITNEWGETYVYMVYEADPELGLTVAQDWETEIEVNGSYDLAILEVPGILDKEFNVGYLLLDNLSAETATIYLRIYDSNNSEDYEGTPLKMTIAF